MTGQPDPEPLVSIILPTHNGSRFLEQSIDSCIGQTYQNWELIIVDDASTDNSIEIINRYAARESKIQVLRHEINRRLPAALNKGFSCARGNYLTWTSDDNCYRPEAIQTMVDFLESNRHVDIVYTDHTRIDEEGHPFAYIKANPVEELALQNVVGPCFLYRQEVQNALGGYNEEMFLVEDYDFWLRASDNFNLQPLHTDLYLYRCHKDSLTTTYSTSIRAAADRALVHNLPQMSWLPAQVRTLAYFAIGTRTLELGLPELDLANIMHSVVEEGLIEAKPDFIVHHFLYEPSGKLRTADRLEKLMSFLPDTRPRIKSYKRKIRGQFHAAYCFQAYQSHDPGEIRRHLLLALRYAPHLLINRTLWRITFWAYTTPSTYP
jgi:glycosyltransferase involved in cell wall biosynthesis